MVTQSGHRNSETETLLKTKCSSETQTQNSETRNALLKSKCKILKQFRFAFHFSITSLYKGFPAKIQIYGQNYFPPKKPLPPNRAAHSFGGKSFWRENILAEKCEL